MFDNYNFGDDYDADEELEYDELLNVRAFLQEHFGGTLGTRIYDTLYQHAKKAADEHGGEPAVLFRGRGGIFASIHEEQPGDEQSAEDW